MINKEKIYESFVNVLSFLPFSALIRIQRKQLMLPLYHTVSDKRLAHVIHHVPYRSVKQFESDLDFFQKYFVPVSLSDVIKSIKENTELPDNSFLLTFDDGYSECYDVIAPILRRRSIPAVFFLNSDFIDNKEMAFRDKASLLVDRIDLITNKTDLTEAALLLGVKQLSSNNVKTAILSLNYSQRIVLDQVAKVLKFDFKKFMYEEKPYLNSDQIKDLIDQGFMIGSHSVDHPLFSELAIEDQLIQVKSSFKMLNEKFELPVNAFAFPFTDNGVGKEFFEKTHFDGLIDISFGTSDFSEGHCENNFQRQPMERWNDSALGIYKKLLSSEILTNIL